MSRVMPSQTSHPEAAEHRYIQVARALRKEIVDGIYPVGSQLPTEHELCQRFSVSRYTVREALRRLREDNLVSSRPRSGTTVVPRPSLHTYAQDAVSINDLLDFATGTHFTIEFVAMVTVDELIAARTGLGVGEQWLAVRGFRGAEGAGTQGADAPVCHTEYYINRSFAAVGRMLGNHTGPIFPLIEDLYGTTVVQVHQEIAAVQIGAELADELKVATGTPALQLQRTYTTSDGEVAQVTVNTHPAGRFRHSMTMRRVKGQ